MENCGTVLGTEDTLTADLFKKLSECAAVFYGTKEKTTDAACWKIFERKHHKKKKIIDMSSLSPCTTVLHLHAKGCGICG